LPYLQQHFPEKIIAFDVASLCDMDPFAFSRAFRREQGTTFRDYLMRLRIESAAAQLRTSDKSIVDVGCSVGFNDASQFARLFRRHMGVTPRAYRNSARADCGQTADELAAG
jgi:transcriptional regulator GlxA family with amidase domain